MENTIEKKEFLWYALYGCIYMVIAAIWYRVGQSDYIETRLWITLLIFVAPSVLPELLFRLLGTAFKGSRKQVKKVYSQLRQPAIIGNTFLFGLVLTVMDSSEPMYGLHWGYVVAGVFLIYIPLTCIGWLLKRVKEYLEFVEEVDELAADKEEGIIKELLCLIKSISCCQGYPGVPVQMYIHFKAYRVLVEFYYEREALACSDWANHNEDWKYIWAHTSVSFRSGNGWETYSRYLPIMNCSKFQSEYLLEKIFLEISAYLQEHSINADVHIDRLEDKAIIVKYNK